MTPDAPMPALTQKQQRFVEEYLLDTCAGKAAIRAGFSKKTANQQGHILLGHPGIRAAIDAAKIKRSEKTEIDADRVLEEIAAMAFYDPAELIGVMRELASSEECREGEGVISFNGKRYAISGISTPAHIAGLPENVRRAIVGWSWDRNENFTLKLADKSKALDQLARHLSLYNDRIEVSTLAGLADRLERAHRHDAPFSPSFPSALPAPPALPPANVVPANVVPASDPSPAEQPEPAAPNAPPSRPKPYRPITAPEPAPWPLYGGFVKSEYDPLT